MNFPEEERIFPGKLRVATVQYSVGVEEQTSGRCFRFPDENGVRNQSTCPEPIMDTIA